MSNPVRLRGEVGERRCMIRVREVLDDLDAIHRDILIREMREAGDAIRALREENVRLLDENRRMRAVIDDAAQRIQRRMVADSLLHKHAASGECIE